MRTDDILNEEVFSSLAIAYHRTHNIKDTNAIGESGFRAGGGKMYGVGIYLTYSFEDQQDERMKTTYGPFIVRCKTNLTDFLIFDRDIAMRVYGDAQASLEAQLTYFGIKPTNTPGDLLTTMLEQHNGGEASGGVTARAARTFAGWLTKQKSRPQRPIKGLVFTGQQDGRVIVAYDPSVVIPFAWARVINLEKTRETVKWNKIVAPPLRHEPIAMSQTERAARYFKTQGFTLISRGAADDPGVTMLGVRGGDYLSLVVTRYTHSTPGVYKIGVKAFCTRRDPLAMKVAGYAEHRGWPLIYKDFTIANAEDKLPLQTILTTIFTTHDAMKQHAEHHVVFTEALLRHILKPSVTIQRENKAGGDYRHDDIMLRAGSVTVKLDSPYQDFTSGGVTIAAEPVSLSLGFNDGSRNGEATLAGAYASLIKMVRFERVYARLQWQWPDDLQPQFIADLEQALKTL